ncbi:MAG: hypothetical protein M1814_005871 [Vezdaea aestivalis]|nr:MAG: hypothetical protein M1814_005871 [Vezdaea aestivalis]
MALNSQVTNLVIILAAMQGSKKINFEDPMVLNGFRILYVLSNLIIVGIYVYMGSKINKKKDMTTIKYVEPAPMGSSDEPKLVTTTIHAYDNSQLRSAYKGQLMGVAMMAGMHLYMKYTNPLLIQSIIPVKSAIEGNLAQIYLFGKKPIGDLKRPWKAAGFPGMPAQDIKSDKKSVESAERSGRGGAKDE